MEKWPKMTKIRFFHKISQIWYQKHVKKPKFYDFCENWVIFAIFVVVSLQLIHVKYMFKNSIRASTNLKLIFIAQWPPLRPRYTTPLIFTVPRYVVSEPCTPKNSNPYAII